MTFTSWAEYAFYFVTMFWRRISIFGQFPLHKQGTLCKNQPALDSGHRACHVVGAHANITPGNQLLPHMHYRTTVRQWSKTLILWHWISRAVQLHGMHNDQNLTPVDFYMKSLVYAEGIGRISKFFSKT
ncbi:hypothetical protein SFRURICE_009857 [Spodoptera frugiperda]|nr:hypothetical protein SFRURICE_009857 [Spodoptera frugiperda]